MSESTAANEGARAFPRYWTWPELQSFLPDNDLAIATGLAGDDDMALTAKGEELFDVSRWPSILAGACRDDRSRPKR